VRQIKKLVSKQIIMIGFQSIGQMVLSIAVVLQHLRKLIGPPGDDNAHQPEDAFNRVAPLHIVVLEGLDEGLILHLDLHIEVVDFVVAQDEEDEDVEEDVQLGEGKSTCAYWEQTSRQ
jgi:hypothetical protein